MKKASYPFIGMVILTILWDFRPGRKAREQYRQERYWEDIEMPPYGERSYLN